MLDVTKTFSQANWTQLFYYYISYNIYVLYNMYVCCNHIFNSKIIFMIIWMYEHFQANNHYVFFHTVSFH